MLLLAGPVLLAGCSGDGGAAPTESAAPPPTVTEAPAEAASETESRRPSQRQRTYTVKRGDTLSAIAERFDTTVRALVRANDLDDPDAIVVGEELRIPRP